MSFFPAFSPPTSGGEQRYFYFYKYLSNFFDVCLLSATFPNAKLEEVVHSPTFREIRVPKPAESDTIHWQLTSEGIGPECSGVAFALASSHGEKWSDELALRAKHADVVIHESPFTLAYDKTIGIDGVMRVYNAYNVEYKLASQIFKGEIGVRATDFVRFLEAELISHSSIIFAISEEEAEVFATEFAVPNEQIISVPNGFEPRSGEQKERSIPRGREVLFLGSAHPPNIEALDFIAQVLAPTLPDVIFNILGSVCGAYKKTVSANVRLLGFVDQAEKSRLLDVCGLAINPLSSGAGTNLKMLDYISHGAPVLSTALGARGLAMSDGKDIFLAELEMFANKIRLVLADPSTARHVALCGKRKIWDKYSWQAIASQAANALELLFVACEEKPKRRRVLAVCDYSVDRPKGGGQVRISEMLRELGREFDVTYLCFAVSSDSSVQILAEGVTQVAIAKSSAHLEQLLSVDNGHSVSVADVVAGLHCREGCDYYEEFVKLVAHSDVVLFEQCYLAELLKAVPDSVPVVYSSQNVELHLKQVLYEGRSDGKFWLDIVQKLESAMLCRSALTVCVTQADADVFSTMVAPTRGMVVVENGVRLRSLISRGALDCQRLAIFLGSAHPPNVRAVRFIIEKLAPMLPDIDFAIAGSVCDAVAGMQPPKNVLLLGFIEENEKISLLQLADIAVNPLFEGGGSSLKVPDFFAAGLPMVTSPIGVRGYKVTPGVHMSLADAGNFSNAVEELMRNAMLRQSMSTNSRRFAEEELDWELLGGKFRRSLRELLPKVPRKRLLVVTYRFGTPPRGGAETFLLRTLEQLTERGDYEIDVVSTRVGSISDHLHFSAIYGEPESFEGIPTSVRRVRYFDVDKNEVDAFADAGRLNSLWMVESLELGRRLSTRDTSAGTLGGWNHPETTLAGTVRWASRCAQVRVPEGARCCVLRGNTPQKSLSIAVSDGERMLGSWAVDGYFSVEIMLSGEVTLLDFVSNAAMSVGNDARELCFIATSIEFINGSVVTTVNLAAGMEERARALDTAAWVLDLIAVTELRDPADDMLFERLRGPRSRPLERWLNENVVAYDLVLVQGVPFATVPMGISICRRNGVPCIALPHFHIDDRYYHWQSFYEAFRHADRVIAAPAQSKTMFFDRIGATSIVLPGGGLDPADFTKEVVMRGCRAFREIHSSSKPFVLILGRKAGAKNYEMTLRAIDALRLRGAGVEVVMIGPDDDGVQLDASRVSYYGAQPREVVIGALSDALCLINMSNSESFGIVLLEAWMAGTPVIARATCGAFAELVIEGHNGFLAEDENAVALSIELYLESPFLAKAHADQGLLSAKDFSWGVLAEKLSRVLDEVCSQRHTLIR